MLAGLGFVSMAVALIKRGRNLVNQSGFTLVAVLVAVLLLTLTAAAVFQTIAVGRQSAVAAQRRTYAVGLARQYVIDSKTNAVTIYYNHIWCRPEQTWDTDSCEQGG